MNTDGAAVAAPVGNYHDNVSAGSAFPFFLPSERRPVASVMTAQESVGQLSA